MGIQDIGTSHAFCRFHLVRNEDISGISGTGVIAEGIQFTDDAVVIKWLTAVNSITVFKNIDDMLKIHGHSGATVVQWIDEYEN